MNDNGSADIASMVNSLRDEGKVGHNFGGVPSPSARPTTTKEYIGKAKSRFHCDCFIIGDEGGGESYSKFMNWLIEPGKNRILLRETQSFDQTGALIRVVDYTTRFDDTSSYMSWEPTAYDDSSGDPYSKAFGSDVESVDPETHKSREKIDDSDIVEE